MKTVEASAVAGEKTSKAKAEATEKTAEANEKATKKIAEAHKDAATEKPRGGLLAREREVRCPRRGQQGFVHGRCEGSLRQVVIPRQSPDSGATRSRRFASLRNRAHGRARGIQRRAPLRSELFNADQMEQHGKRLAAAHRLAAGRHPDRLLSRLDENAGILEDVCAC
jgi:hypothetical protein